jgi:hypothetical protein
MKRKRKMQFSDKSHTTNGIIATILGGVSLVLMIALVILSYIKKGEAGVYAGAIGLTAFMIATIGLFTGISSFKERERYYLFSKIGSLLNAIIIALWVAIYIIGTWFI